MPRPLPAILGLPEWFKTMPAEAFSAVMDTEQMTVKKCPPFIDAMTYGFLIPLVTDVRVEDGAFSWDFDLPSGPVTSYTRSPLDFHDNSQVAGPPKLVMETEKGAIRFLADDPPTWLTMALDLS